jgi:hypothetical protein
MQRRPSALSLVAVFLLGSLLVSCSGSGGGGGAAAPAGGFALTRISVDENAIWEINRRIELTFSKPVEFLSVSSNTIQVVSETGAPATGQFSFRRVDTDGDGRPDTTDETTIVFQPNCPTRPDLSDAGLLPGGTRYELTVIGLSGQAQSSVRSQTNEPLEVTQRRSFRTPASADPAALFLDTDAGAPEPLVRTKGATHVTDGITYVELGEDAGDPEARIFFEFDPATQTYGHAPGTRAPGELPLNLYSDARTATAVMVEFDQAVNPAATNVSSRRIRLEIEDAGGNWLPIDTRVELVANCTLSGATVRLEPIGVLPTGSRFRVVVLPGFQDLVGETRLLARDEFAIAPTEVLSYTSLDPARPGDGADEFHEEFLFGGSSIESFQDADALFDSPAATWEDGRLTASFDFTGDGGPGGDFDWIVRTGEIFLFDTTATSIVGGPNGVPTTIQNTIGGVVDVRNLHVEAGGTLRVQGGSTMLINATGEVRVDGTLDLSGFNAKNVATLGTGHQPEVGGAGAAGGGKGGLGSPVTVNSTPRGGRGDGPFGESGTGGQGGESAFAAGTGSKENRRPGGGGGGGFAQDFNTNVGGLFAGRGADGHANGRGAITGKSPARGGVPGKGPFLDDDDGNDFLGVKPVTRPDGQGGFDLIGLVRGELTGVWAGYGGGGGGDALPSTGFPTRNWSPASDEKGGGGGGAGGGLRVRALDQIVFGAAGRILANGGNGGLGENTLFLDHIGGTGGSGSGGHVVLESAVRIDFANGNPGSSAGNRVHVSVAGAAGVIGAGTDGNGNPIPQGVSHGGSGGPGLAQLHVPRALLPPSDDPATSDIVLPTRSLNSTNPLNQVVRPAARDNAGGTQLIPTFGARSKARSRWISIGGADLDPDPAVGNRLIQLLFDGVETADGPAQGRVRTTAGEVDELDALLGPAPIPSSTVELRADGLTLVLSGAALDPLIASTEPISEDIYLRTPALLRNFVLRVDDALDVSNRTDFDVLDASYDDGARRLTLTVDGAATTIAAAVGGVFGTPQYRLLPRFFRFTTDGVVNALPDSAFVRFTFDGAGDDGFGNPDEANLLVAKTGDVGDLNVLQPGELKFFRFEVEFDLDALGNGLSTDTKPVALDFLKIPFRFSVPGP